MEQIDIDEIDLRLLDQLQQDASLSNLELAERVHTSPVRRGWPSGYAQCQ